MPLSFSIEDLRQQYNCSHYFETGMWDPVQTDISSWKAVESNFDTVHCIEIRKDFVDKAEILFNQHVQNGSLHRSTYVSLSTIHKCGIPTLLLGQKMKHLGFQSAETPVVSIHSRPRK